MAPAGLDAQDDDTDMELDGYDDFSDDAGNAVTCSIVSCVNKSQLQTHAFRLDYQLYCLIALASCHFMLRLSRHPSVARNALICIKMNPPSCHGNFPCDTQYLCLLLSLQRRHDACC